MGGRSRRLRNAARRAGNPVAKGRGMIGFTGEESPEPVKKATKKKKTTKKK